MQTDLATRPTDERTTARRTHPRADLALVSASLALGALTSWAQGWLPDALMSFANSVSGWTVCTALLVGVLRPTLRRGAVWGAVSFVCLVLGYTLAARARGLSYDPALWAGIGVLAGPFVGAAAAAATGRRDRLQASVGSGLLAGVLVADGVRGLTTVAASTSPVYWALVLTAAALLLVGVAALRLRAAAPVLLQLAVAAVTGLALTVGMRLLG